jgi:hypothetical protein
MGKIDCQVFLNSALLSMRALPNKFFPRHVPLALLVIPQVVSRQVLPSINSRSSVDSNLCARGEEWENLAAITSRINASLTSSQSPRRVTDRPNLFALRGVSASSTILTSSASNVFSDWKACSADLTMVSLNEKGVSSKLERYAWSPLKEVMGGATWSPSGFSATILT